MKRGFIFSALLCAVAVTLDAQVRQEGTAVLQNSGHQPLAGVQVMAVGAAPASSDGNGRFFLEFRSGRPGDMLKVNDIYKSGYSLVNEAALRNWRLSGDRPVEVVLCPTDVLLNRQEEYYGVGRVHYQSRYEAALAALDSLQKAGMLAREEYEARLDAAGAEYADAMSRLEEYAYMIACINTDDLNELEREVYALVRDGDVSGALQLLDRAQVSERFRRLQSMGKEAGEDLEAMIPSMKYYADICMFDGGKDNLLKARSVLEEIALSDTTNYVYAQEYAEALADSFLDYEEAVHWFGVALRHVTDSLAKFGLLQLYGQAFVKLADYDNAFEVFATGSAMIDQLLNNTYEDADYEYLLKALVEFMRGLAQVDYALSNFTEALDILTETVLENSSALYGFNPEKYAYLHGKTVSDIAAVMIESRYMAEEGLKCEFTARDLFRKVPKERELEAAKEIIESYIFSAAACNNLGRYDEALVYMDSTVRVIEKYEPRNPVLFIMYKAGTLDSQGTIMVNQGNVEAGLEKLKSALEAASVLPEKSMLAVNASIYYHLAAFGEHIPDKRQVAFYAGKACELYDQFSYFSYHPSDVGAYMIYIDVLIQLGDLTMAADKLIEILIKLKTLAEHHGPDLPLAGMTRFIELAGKLKNDATTEFWRDMFTDMLKAYPPSAEKREVRKLVDAL